MLLNITPDHLDRYGNCMQNYVDAKMRILQNQEETDAFVYWNDDPVIQKELARYDIKAKKCPFSILKKEGMIGYIADGQYVLESPEPFNMEQEALALEGKHNMYNSLAAGITASLAGIKNEVIRKSLGDFEGVEHRLERVTRVRGVDYINDSKATNVDACWYALESMKTPTVLIIGGKDKGNDYRAIADLVKRKCVGLVYLGADNRKLHDFFDWFRHSCGRYAQHERMCGGMLQDGASGRYGPAESVLCQFRPVQEYGRQGRTVQDVGESFINKGRRQYGHICESIEEVEVVRGRRGHLDDTFLSGAYLHYRSV